jgi:curved DNA-binding protein CbpA
MSESSPQPVAAGDLAKTPFAHVLLHLHQRERTGTLVIWPKPGGEGGQDRIRFEAGWPVGARFVEKAAALDRGLLRFFALVDAPYAFYAEDLVGEAQLTGRVDPWMIIAASLRGPSRDDAIGAYISGIGLDTTVRFRAGDTKRYQLLPKEAAFLDIVRSAPARVDELLSLCELGPGTGRRLLYLFFVTNTLERFDATAAAPAKPKPAAAAPAASSAVAAFEALPIPDFDDVPASKPASPSPAKTSGRTSLAPDTSTNFTRSMPIPDPAPEGLSADATAFWNEVIARCEKIEKQNYYDMLEVAREASAETIRKSYYAIAKRWHPDRVTGELAPLKPYVEACFAIFTLANETLGDDKKRANYLRQVQDGGGTPEADRQMEAILWAAKEHQKAEVLFKRRDFEGAATILASAIQVTPDEADVLAAYAWALFNMPITEERDQEMLTIVTRAIAIEPKHDRAHYYKGLMHVRAGQDSHAAKHFREAAQINPKNLDAAREVRLVEMRNKGAAPTNSKAPPPKDEKGKPKDDGNFLSKLFGAKKS